MSETVGKIEQLTVEFIQPPREWPKPNPPPPPAIEEKDYYMKDIYKPKVLPPRAKQFRDTFFAVVDDMRRRLETDDIFDADAFIKKLEDMKPDVDYLCII